MTTQARLKELFDYDPETGFFIRRVTAGPNAKKGARAGTPHKAGRSLMVDSVPYLEHRLAFLYVHGRWPSALASHTNLNKSDNRIDNVREATASQVCWNIKRPRHNTSGFKGVSRTANSHRWRAAIWKNKKYKWLGVFDTPEEAHAAYTAAAEKMFGEFARAL